MLCYKNFPQLKWLSSLFLLLHGLILDDSIGVKALTAITVNTSDCVAREQLGIKRISCPFSIRCEQTQIIFDPLLISRSAIFGRRYSIIQCQSYSVSPERARLLWYSPDASQNNSCNIWFPCDITLDDFSVTITHSILTPCASKDRNKKTEWNYFCLNTSTFKTKMIRKTLEVVNTLHCLLMCCGFTLHVFPQTPPWKSIRF